ncbi:hypothetical protein MMC34_000351 [Xylographa carneopallida]|nr:hypothetical protein [Xylographa carneopallida]
MKAYVEAKLNNSPEFARNEPLLHTAINRMIRGSLTEPNYEPPFEMFEFLLSKGVSVTGSLQWTVPSRDLGDPRVSNIPISHIPRDAGPDTFKCITIQCISYKAPSYRPTGFQIVSYLITQGVDPGSVICSAGMTWSIPLLHAVVAMRLQSSHKWALLEKLCHKGADVTTTRDYRSHLLGAIHTITFLEAVQKYFPDIGAPDFKSLLVRGARITARMLASPRQFDNFTWRDIDKKEWYERSARLVAWAYHPEWSILTLVF